MVHVNNDKMIDAENEFKSNLTLSPKSYIMNFDKFLAIYNFIVLSACMIQNFLCRYEYLDFKYHYMSLLLYTKLDLLFIIQNPRRYSLFIHHIATIHLLNGALQYSKFEKYSDISLLELTTVFNALNIIYKTRVTLMLRNTAWISIRLCLLPYLTYHILSTILYSNVLLYMRYGHSIITLTILSFEWTNELLKLNLNNISHLYYIIPVAFQLYTYQYSKLILTVLYWLFFSTQICTRIIRYENKLMFNFATSYLLLL